MSLASHPLVNCSPRLTSSLGHHAADCASVWVESTEAVETAIFQGFGQRYSMRRHVGSRMECVTAAFR